MINYVSQNSFLSVFLDRSNHKTYFHIIFDVRRGAASFWFLLSEVQTGIVVLHTCYYFICRFIYLLWGSRRDCKCNHPVFLFRLSNSWVIWMVRARRKGASFSTRYHSMKVGVSKNWCSRSRGTFVWSSLYLWVLACHNPHRLYVTFPSWLLALWTSSPGISHDDKSLTQMG